jgi:hypothetical protein
MAANAYVRTIEVTGDWQPLADASLVLNAWIRIWTTMAVTTQLSIRVNGGEPASVPKGVDFNLEGVDLSQIEVKGDGFYRVTVIGYTR